MPMIRSLWAAWATPALLISICPTVAQPRTAIDLTGTWQVQRTSDLDAPPGDEWGEMAVPGMLFGTDYQRAWLRRTVELPTDVAGRRLKLRFNGVKYNSRVLLNGVECGGNFGGYEPFEVDVTQAAKPGETNELLIGVHDWTGVFDPDEPPVDFSQLQPGQDARHMPQDRILSPIGGVWNGFGIWDRCELVALPAVHVADLFIQTSVREQRLTVEVMLRNESGEAQTVQVGGTVLPRGPGIPAWRPVELQLDAGATEEMTLTAQWDDPRSWSPEDPHLYTLRLTAAAGDNEDALDTRFGFREFWVEGGEFYLNGVKRKLLATSTWPAIPVTREYVEDILRRVKEANCIAHRLHTQPWQKVWYEVADEIGLLIIEEAAIWNDDDVYRVNDQRFWDNYALHLQRMILRDRNHPSLVMWSLENEMYGGRLNDESPAKEQLVELGRKVKQWDPTRPITYESDGDPGGVADVIGLHYPHEYPTYVDWPNTAWWMDEPIRIGHMFLEGEGGWVWKRGKPLYIGEFLWLPSSNPDWHTVFFGDDAYLNYPDYRNRGKAESWRMQTEAYRWYGVNGICPWTMFEGGPLDADRNHLYRAVQRTFQPLAAFVKEYDRSFFAGDKVTRTVSLYNDVPVPSRLRLQWQFGEQEGERAFRMQPAERQDLVLELTAPETDERTPFDFVLTVRDGGKGVFTETRRCVAHPRRKITGPDGVALYDPRGDTVKALGGRATRVRDLASIPDDVALLVIGERAFDEEQIGRPVVGDWGETAHLQQWVRRGGRLLVLAQDAYPPGLFPTSLTAHTSTMTFPQVRDHPCLAGVEPDDLKFWRDDHYVSFREPARPAAGTYRPLIVSGHAMGLAHAPLLELPRGRGTILLCQLRLVEKLTREPTAQRLLQNCLDYLADYSTALKPLAAFELPEPTQTALTAVGYATTPLTALPAGDEAQQFAAVMTGGACAGALGDLGATKNFLNGGGVLYCHRPTEEAAARLLELAAADLHVVRSGGPITRVDPPDWLTRSLTREDLYWMAEHVGRSWSPTPLTPAIADFSLMRSLDAATATAYATEGMQIEGKHHSLQDGVAWLASGDCTARFPADFGDGGEFVFGARAGGTPVDDVHPALSISVADQLIGHIQTQQLEPTLYTLAGTAPPGEHEVVVRFTNDRQLLGVADRNLALEEILIAPAPPLPEGIRLLTNPAALARLQVGAGTVIVDYVNWDVEQRNRARALRYASALLTELGTDYTELPYVALECEGFTPKPDMAHFSAHSGRAHMGTNGWVEGDLPCARDGDYILEIRAGGSAVDDVYPIVDVEIDGEKIGTVELRSSAAEGYRLPARLTAGEHKLRLHFTNDEHRPPLDRNLWVDKVLIYPGETPQLKRPTGN